MTDWQRFRAIAEYPGSLLFAVSWALLTRHESEKGFVERMLDAAEDAMVAF